MQSWFEVSSNSFVLLYEKVSQTQHPFFSSAPTPNCEWVRALPVENGGCSPQGCKRLWSYFTIGISAWLVEQPLCFWWAPAKGGRTQGALVGAHPALICFRLPCTPLYMEMSSITAALLLRCIKPVLHLQ